MLLGAPQAVDAISAQWSFQPNVITIPTSEGAPYGDAYFWTPGSTDFATTYGTYGPTKVIRLYICLSGQVDFDPCSQQPAVTGPLSSDMLAKIDMGISARAGKGVRLIIRFTYNFGPIGPSAMDAPISIIASHIDQLAPILIKNKDLIFALEAGFIGTWGEWHDSTNGNDTAGAHKIVLDKEISYFGSYFPILVRYPRDLLAYTGTFVPRENLGLHDDYYASEQFDAGTWNPGGGYSTQQLVTYAEALSTVSMFAGEFGALYPTLQNCASLEQYSYLYHLQSISLHFYPPEIGTYLDAIGCTPGFLNKVGTRIVLQSASINGDAAPGGALQIALTMVNAGYGRVVRARPAVLALVSNGSTIAQYSIPLGDLDLRTLASSATPVAHTFTLNVTLPTSLPSGQISAALLVPDPAPSLSGQPAFALPLNSVDGTGASIFDKNTGLNVFATFPSTVPPPAAPDLNQHGLTGSWYKAATSGQGIEVEIFPNPSSGTGSIFVSWFTYDTVAGGADRQRWYTVQGPVATGQPNAALTIYQNTGGNFTAPPVTNAQAVGTATLSFDTCTSGQMSYAFTDGTGRTGTIPLTRLTQNVTCSTTSQHPTNADFGLSGNWFNAATSGQGLTIEVNSNSNALFAAWYTYLPSGSTLGAAGQRWYTAQGDFTPGKRSIPVTIYETTGGMFDTATPPRQKTTPVGSGTLAFQSCSAATFAYNFTGGSSIGLSGLIALSRVGPVPPGCTS